MDDLEGGKAARDEGISLVLANERREWLTQAQRIVIDTFEPGWIGLAEEFHAPVLARLRAPHHPNVWGAFTNSLIRAGYFEHTGGHANCRKRTSHACDGKFLRRITPKKEGEI